MALMLTITNKGDIASSLGAPVLMNIEIKKTNESGERNNRVL